MPRTRHSIVSIGQSGHRAQRSHGSLPCHPGRVLSDMVVFRNYKFKRFAHVVPDQETEGGPRASGRMSRRANAGVDRIGKTMASDLGIADGQNDTTGARIADATDDVSRHSVVQGQSIPFLSGLSVPCGVASKTPELPHMTWNGSSATTGADARVMFPANP